MAQSSDEADSMDVDEPVSGEREPASSGSSSAREGDAPDDEESTGSRHSSSSSRNRRNGGGRRSRKRKQPAPPLSDYRKETVVYIPGSSAAAAASGANQISGKVPLAIPAAISFMFDLGKWKSTWHRVVNRLETGGQLKTSSPYSPDKILEDTRLFLLDMVRCASDHVMMLVEQESTLPPTFHEGGVMELDWLNHLAKTMNFLEAIHDIFATLPRLTDAVVANPASPLAVRSLYIVEGFVSKVTVFAYTRLQPWITTTFRLWNERRRDDVIGLGADGMWSSRTRVACFTVLAQMFVLWNNKVLDFVRRVASAEQGFFTEDDAVLSKMEHMSLREWGAFYDAMLVPVDELRTQDAVVSSNMEMELDENGAVDLEFQQSSYSMADTVFTWFSNPASAGVPIRLLPNVKYTNMPELYLENAPKLQLERTPTDHVTNVGIEARLILPKQERLWNLPEAQGIDLDRPLNRLGLVDVLRLARWIQEHQFCLSWNPLLEWLVNYSLFGIAVSGIGNVENKEPVTWESLTDAEIEENLYVDDPKSADGTKVVENFAKIADMERMFGYWLGITELGYRFAQVARPYPAAPFVQVFYPDIKLQSFSFEDTQSEFIEPLMHPVTREESVAWCRELLMAYKSARQISQYRDLLTEKLTTAGLGYFVHPRVLEKHVENTSKVASRNFLDLLRISRKTDANSLMYTVYHPDAPVYMAVYNTCHSADAVEMYQAIFDDTLGHHTANEVPVMEARPTEHVSLPTGHDTLSREKAAIARIARQALHTGPMIPARVKSDAYPRLFSYFHQQVLDSLVMKTVMVQLLSSPEISARLSSNVGNNSMKDVQQSVYLEKLVEAAYAACKEEMEDAAEVGVLAQDALSPVRIPQLTKRVKDAIDFTLKQLKGASDSANGENDEEDEIDSAKNLVVNVPRREHHTTGAVSAAAAAAAATAKGSQTSQARSKQQSLLKSTFKTNVVTIHYSIRALGFPMVIQNRGYRSRLRYALDPVGYAEAFFNSGKRTAPTWKVNSFTGHVTFVEQLAEPHVWSMGTDHWVYIPGKLFVRTRNYVLALKIYTKACLGLGLNLLIDQISKEVFR